MIIDLLSDLHGHYPLLDGGDLLIIAGDLTATDTPRQHLEFAVWLANQDYKHRVFIGGNHDNQLVDWCPIELDGGSYLCNSGCEFQGLKIWGSPHTIKFEGQNPHAMAFSCDTLEEMHEKAQLIPLDTDILITHTPPWTILDKTLRNENAGCPHLLAKVSVVKPTLHVFGHIHEAYGKDFNTIHPTMCVNASHVDRKYRPVNKPIRIEL